MTLSRIQSNIRDQQYSLTYSERMRNEEPMKAYTITWSKPDRTQEVIATTTEPEDLHKCVESLEYIGTWLTPTRKLLRHGRGELFISITDVTMRIAHHELFERGAYRAYELHMSYGRDGLTVIRIDTSSVAGFDQHDNELWRTSSFTILADIVGKEVAFQCHRYYDQYLQEFDLHGVI